MSTRSPTYLEGEAPLYIPFPEPSLGYCPQSWAVRLSSAGERLIPLGDECHPVPGITWTDWEGEKHPVDMFGGYGSTEHVDWQMVKSHINRHIFRVVPWAKFWCAPSFSGCANFSGMAWGREGVALLRTTDNGNHALETAFHEAWHLLEEWLPESLLGPLDAALARGPGYAPQWSRELGGGREDYLSRACERRARFFSRFAMNVVDGGGLPDFMGNPSSPWNVAYRAWSGELGAIDLEKWEKSHG